MRCVLSYPGVMEHAQQAALALQEAGCLEQFVTAFTFDERGVVAGALNIAPSRLADPVRRELRRRSVMGVLADRTTAYAFWEVLRTVAAKAGAGPIMTDRIWDIGAHRFDAAVARRHVPDCEAIVGFEYTALESFRRARDLGVARVLHLPSLDSRAFKVIEDQERAAWPELRGSVDPYFERKFEERYQRRCDEIALADVIIANSSLTRRSHVAAGADPAKVFVAPLAAPPPIDSPREVTDTKGALNVLWSGVFSLRKGSHHMLEGWKLLSAGQRARLCVYGHIATPEPLMRAAAQDIEFMGSVPRAVMLDAFGAADVMIFPTLSDGFGMAATEALSRGVPVITTDQAGVADLIEDGKNGLIIPAGDPAAIRDALQWCLDNRGRLAEMRWHALETARRNQWSDYRRNVMRVMDEGLRGAGYSPRFAALPG